MSVADRRTRHRLTRLLLERGPQTAVALSEALGLTAAGVRRHLDAMLAEGVLVTTAARVYGRRGRGRPARLYGLSDAGHEAMPNGYDDLATAALDYLETLGGDAAVAGFARARVAELERRYRPALDAVAPDQRPAELAAAFSGDGYAARTLEFAGGGTQLCQHHCPVQHVAEVFPQLCDAETAAIGRLLGTHVQRLATIAHGDGVCTTHIPAAVRPSARPSARPSPPLSARTTTGSRPIGRTAR